MTKTNSDYAQGFKDGFAAGLEEGKKLAPKQTRLDDLMIGSTGCAVCGRYDTKPMGLVCMHPGCPSRVTCGTPMHGGLDQGLGKSFW